MRKLTIFNHQKRPKKFIYSQEYGGSSKVYPGPTFTYLAVLFYVFMGPGSQICKCFEKTLLYIHCHIFTKSGTGSKTISHNAQMPHTFHMNHVLACRTSELDWTAAVSKHETFESKWKWKAIVESKQIAPKIKKGGGGGAKTCTIDPKMKNSLLIYLPSYWNQH